MAVSYSALPLTCSCFPLYSCPKNTHYLHMFTYNTIYNTSKPFPKKFKGVLYEEKQGNTRTCIKLFKLSVRHAQEGVVVGIVYSEVAR